jgi:predicted nicotinamide N-methyase
MVSVCPRSQKFWFAWQGGVGDGWRWPDRVRSCTVLEMGSGGDLKILARLEAAQSRLETQGTDALAVAADVTSLIRWPC